MFALLTFRQTFLRLEGEGIQPSPKGTLIPTAASQENPQSSQEMVSTEEKENLIETIVSTYSGLEKLKQNYREAGLLAQEIKGELFEIGLLSQKRNLDEKQKSEVLGKLDSVYEKIQRLKQINQDNAHIVKNLQDRLIKILSILVLRQLYLDGSSWLISLLSSTFTTSQPINFK